LKKQSDDALAAAGRQVDPARTPSARRLDARPARPGRSTLSASILLHDDEAAQAGASQPIPSSSM